MGAYFVSRAELEEELEKAVDRMAEAADKLLSEVEEKWRRRVKRAEERVAELERRLQTIEEYCRLQILEERKRKEEEKEIKE